MKKKQTAVEWLLEQWPILESQLPSSIIDEALQMEQDKIEKSYTSGREQWQKYEFAHSNYENDVEIPTPRKYYNDTYGGKE